MSASKKATELCHVRQGTHLWCAAITNLSAAELDKPLADSSLLSLSVLSLVRCFFLRKKYRVMRCKFFKNELILRTRGNEPGPFFSSFTVSNEIIHSS